MIGRDVDNHVDHLLIDELRRLVIAGELAPISTAIATRPILGLLVVPAATTKQLTDALFEDVNGALASLPPLLSWTIQVEAGSGAADLVAHVTGVIKFTIPEAPNAIGETAGSSLGDWWVKNSSGSSVNIRILATTKA